MSDQIDTLIKLVAAQAELRLLNDAAEHIDQAGFSLGMAAIALQDAGESISLGHIIDAYQTLTRQSFVLSELIKEHSR